MRVHRRLKSLRAYGYKKFWALQRRADRISTTKTSVDATQFETEISYVTISALNVWSNICKWYYISCTLGTKSISGAHIAAPGRLADANAAIGIAVRYYKPSARLQISGEWQGRDEPAWHVPSVVIDVFGAASIPTQNHVKSSFSLGFTVFDDLPTFRNYFAHKNRETRALAMRKAPRYLIVANKPSEVLAAAPVGRTDSLLETWIHELRTTLDMLCN